jgi:hypothetical protein
MLWKFCLWPKFSKETTEGEIIKVFIRNEKIKEFFRTEIENE